MTAEDLAVGDCFDSEGDEIAEVDAVPCDQSHTYEVYALVEHKGGADAEFPGDDALNTKAEQLCLPPFEEHVGTDYDSSELFITTIKPSAETWPDGDRTTICSLGMEEGAPLEGSQRDSGR